MGNSMSEEIDYREPIDKMMQQHTQLVEVLLSRHNQNTKEEEKLKPKLLDNPWRNVGSDTWSVEFQDRLKDEIIDTARPKNKDVNYCKILEIGPIGAGKTSLFNTIASPFEGRVSFRGNTAVQGGSVTSKLREYSIKCSYESESLPFRICDTLGLQNEGGISLVDFEYLINGNVPDKYEFNPNVPINPAITNFRPEPKIEEKIHCVCFVFAADTVDIITESTMKKIKMFVARLNQLKIPPVVVLTKMDEKCPYVQRDVSKMYYSTKVKETVDNVSEALGVPRNRIIPVVNYESENVMSVNINISALLALRLMIQSSDDFLKKY